MACPPLSMNRGDTLRLSVPCDLQSVRPAIREVLDFLQQQGLDAQERMDCELALAEACNNAVQYAPPYASAEPVGLEVFCTESDVEFRVLDHTPGFAWPATPSLPTLGTEGGRGLFIIRSLMDRAEYIRGLSSNMLIMAKRRCAQSHRLAESPPGSMSEARRLLARYQEAVKKQAQELCFLSETLHALIRGSSELGREHHLEAFCQRLLSDLAIITSADWYVLRLYREGPGRLEIVSAYPSGLGAEQPVLELEDDCKTAGVEGRAARARGDHWLPREPARATPRGYVNGLVHPLYFGDALIGTLALGRKASQPLFSRAQVEVIHTFGEFLAVQVMNARYQQEHLELRLISHELEFAKNIQRALLPKALPRMNGFSLGTFCESARQVGGDFYEVITMPAGRLLLAVADVMGKGVPAALFASTLRSLIRSMPLWSERPSQWLTHVNRLMYEDLSRVDMFVTAGLALVDLRRRQLIAASAGHCPLLLAPAGERAASLAAGGVPLGILPDYEYTDVTATLPPGARLLLYSDGLTEARNPDGESFGLGRLMKWLDDRGPEPVHAEAMKEDLARELQRFRCAAPLQDDQTFLVLALDGNADIPAPGGALASKFGSNSCKLPSLSLCS